MKTLKFSSTIAAAAALTLGLLGTAAQAAGQVSAWTGGAVRGATTSVAGSTNAAGDLVMSVAGIASYDAQDAAINTTLTLSATPLSTVDAISYNVSLATIGASWLSEAAILFTNSAGDGVILTAGFADTMSGTGTYSDSVLLSDYGLSFDLGADGLMYVQFFETYDDVAGAADANWTAGSVTFGNIGPVPEPSTYALMAFGLAGLGMVARRRKQG